MKRVATLIALAALLGAFVLSNITDTSASVTNTDVPDTEVSSSQTEAHNSSASATITIMMYTLPEE